MKTVSLYSYYFISVHDLLPLILVLISPPTGIKFDVVDQLNVNLVWSPPSDPSGILLDYNILYYGYKQDEAKLNVRACWVEAHPSDGGNRRNLETWVNWHSSSNGLHYTLRK